MKSAREILDQLLEHNGGPVGYGRWKHEALKALEVEIDRIIGEDSAVHDKENPSWTEMRYDAAALGMNSLRTEQRQRLREFLGGQQ